MATFRFKILFLALAAASLFGSCEKDFYVEELNLIENQTFDTDVRVQGHEFNGLIIDNCTFDSGELYISDVDSIIVKNCTFKNQKKNGIRIGFGGQASHIIIDNCTFNTIGSNGIDSHEDAPNGIIKNCLFKNCALSDVGAAMGQAHHAIYWKGENVSILNNTFFTGKQRKGNAISHRSSGLISGNTIIGAMKYGIMYFADHPGGDTLMIENNFISNCKNGIGITTPSKLEYHNKNVIVRFNSIANCETYSVFVHKAFETTTMVSAYGNIIVQEEERYIQAYFDLLDTFNLKSTIDIGFLDVNTGDLHLKSSSTGRNFCNGLLAFPLFDIDGDNRQSLNLDAGADERN
jgi:hypothetical protein